MKYFTKKKSLENDQSDTRPIIDLVLSIDYNVSASAVRVDWKISDYETIGINAGQMLRQNTVNEISPNPRKHYRPLTFSYYAFNYNVYLSM